MITKISESVVRILKKGAKAITNREVLPTAGPMALWALLFIVIPFIILFYYSFLSTGIYGQIIHTFTIQNILKVFQGTYALIFVESFFYAIVTTLLCILIGYPLAYWIGMYTDRLEALFLALIVLPSWATYLLRIYSLTTIFRSHGILNNLLQSLNLIAGPVQFLYTRWIVIFGLVYTWLPMMVLPIYAAITDMDFSLLEAASDLGAGPMVRFFKITFPLTQGGLFAGILLVFAPSLGSYLIPFFLGGGKNMMMGSLISQQINVMGDIPFGSALSITLIIVEIFLVLIYIRIVGQGAIERLV